ncbi:hypothetical protein NC651_001016 [Populus alba x Populus x berolinensis]|nr:hypothetical protein NC651_001016 [Populus alba x Populus x berolinensis]
MVSMHVKLWTRPDSAGTGSTGTVDQYIEHNVGKILKLIHNNGQAKRGKILEDSKKRSALIELVKDFHKKYHSLYAQYDHLRAETGKFSSCWIVID